MTNEAPTPRTDAHAQIPIGYVGDDEAVWKALSGWVDFASELEREILRLRSENAELREELVLAGYEHTSAVEAVNVLFKGLNWSSGGLGAAAIEIVADRDRYRAVLVELVAAWDEANAWDDPRINDAVVAARALTAKGEKG